MISGSALPTAIIFEVHLHFVGGETEVPIRAIPIYTITPTSILEVPIPDVASPSEVTPITKAGCSSFTTPRVDREKGIAIKSDPSPPKLVRASREVRQDPDAPILINYMIDRNVVDEVVETMSEITLDAVRISKRQRHHDV
ncbi:hypothetical protein Tco_0995230 [Tanacetum coccineum]